MAFISIEVSSFVGSILAIIAGVLVLAFPTLLRYMIGLYLLLAGVLGLLTAL